MKYVSVKIREKYFLHMDFVLFAKFQDANNVRNQVHWNVKIVKLEWNLLKIFNVNVKIINKFLITWENVIIVKLKVVVPV